MAPLARVTRWDIELTVLYLELENKEINENLYTEKSITVLRISNSAPLW